MTIYNSVVVAQMNFSEIKFTYLKSETDDDYVTYVILKLVKQLFVIMNLTGQAK